MSKSKFSKIAASVALISAMSMAAGSAFAQDYQQQNQVDPNAPHISGGDFAKNVGFGAVIGAVGNKLLGGSGSQGAIVGVVGGVAKSIYDDMQIKSAAEAQKNQAPVVNSSGIPTPIGATTTPRQITSERPVLQTVSTALMTRVDGSTPHAKITKAKDGQTVIEGDSMQDAIFALGAVAANHKIKVDIVSDQAYSLKQQSLVGEKVVLKFDARNKQETLKTLHRVANDLNMGMLYEDYSSLRNGNQNYETANYSGYVVLASKPLVRQLVADQSLQYATLQGGITSAQVDQTLATIEARANTMPAQNQMNPNYQQQRVNQGPVTYSSSELTQRERTGRIGYYGR